MRLVQLRPFHEVGLRALEMINRSWRLENILMVPPSCFSPIDDIGGILKTLASWIPKCWRKVCLSGLRSLVALNWLKMARQRTSQLSRQGKLYCFTCFGLGVHPLGKVDRILHLTWCQSTIRLRRDKVLGFGDRGLYRSCSRNRN